MAGVIRLANTGGGQSTISGSATSSQTFILPAQGGTLSVGGGGIQDGDSATLDDLTVSGELTVSGSASFVSGDFTIETDGSATSSGNIRAGGTPGGASSAAGVQLQPGGLIQVSRGAGSAVFNAFTNGNATEQLTLNSDGSASFASGTVQIADDGRITLSGSPGIQFGTPDSGGNVTSQTLD